MAEYHLPDLPYDYAALEPHISARIMELHHDKHHAVYVAGANTALAKLAEARDAADYANVPKLEKDLAFHLGGHINHSIFWKNLSPDGGDGPTGELAAAIDEYFGSFERFQRQLTEATVTVQGSGGGALVWARRRERLYIAQIYDHQDNIGQSSGPLLVIDAWEHAYYLQYKNV